MPTATRAERGIIVRMVLNAQRLVRWFLVALAVFLVTAQFVPLERSNPTSDPQHDIVVQLAPPAPVAATFDRSCRDCHANSTRWPWYSRVAPVSWVVLDDVKSGRRRLNLSEWGGYDKARAAEKLKEMCDEVKTGEMPDFKYTLIHLDAKVSDAEVQALCGWTAEARRQVLKAASD
jgi:hypothetical protein